MDKILIEVFCVATSRNYDFWISKKMNVAKAKEKIIEQISSYEENEDMFLDAEEIFMMNSPGAEILEESWSIEEVGLHSGDRLVII